jgi:hypothetical protein
MAVVVLVPVIAKHSQSLSCSLAVQAGQVLASCMWLPCCQEGLAAVAASQSASAIMHTMSAAVTYLTAMDMLSSAHAATHLPKVSSRCVSKPMTDSRAACKV